MALSYEEAAAAVRDLQVDPALLAQVAHEHEALRPAVAAHPAAYPALLEWLAALGDPAVAAVLAARGASAAGSASVPPVPSPAPAPVPAPAAVPAPYDAVAGHPQPHDVPATADGAPPAARKSRRRGVVIGVVGGVVLAVAAGGLFVYAKVFSKLGGAATPEAAVTQILEGVASKDAIAIYGVMSPAELATFPDLRKTLEEQVEVPVPEEIVGGLESAWDSVKLELEGLEVDVEEIDDDVAKVYITRGTLSLDYDVDKVTDGLMGVMYEWESPLNPSGRSVLYMDDSYRDDYLGQEREYLRESLDVPASDLRWSASELRFDTYAGRTSDPFVMAVREGGSWYVSPMLTAAEYAFVLGSDERRGKVPAADSLTRFDSPEAVVAALPEVARELERGRLDTAYSVLPLAERRLLAMYGEGIVRGGGGDWPLSFGTFEGKVISTEGNRALVGVDEVTVSYQDPWDDSRFDLRLHDVFCYEYEGVTYWGEYEDHGGCLDELPIAMELGADQLGLVAVQESTGWHLSVVGTFVHATTTVSEGLAKLADDGIEMRDLDSDHPLLRAPASSRAAWAGGY